MLASAFDDQLEIDVENLIEISSPDDLYSRPNLIDNINHEETRLVAIIGSYLFAKDIPCSLQDCHTPHKKGLLAVTVDGKEAVIGHQCGRSKFALDFDALHNRHKRARKVSDLRAEIEGYCTDSEITDRLDRLLRQPKGGYWSDAITRSFRSNLPTGVRKRFTEMIQRGETSVTFSRERSKEELDAARAANPNESREALRYVEISPGALRGMKAFQGPTREIAARGLSQLRLARETELKKLSDRQLQTLAQHLRNTRREVDQIEEVIKATRTFFQPANLGLLVYLAHTALEQDEIERLQVNAEAGTVTLKTPKRTKAWKRKVSGRPDFMDPPEEKAA